MNLVHNMMSASLFRRAFILVFFASYSLIGRGENIGYYTCQNKQLEIFLLSFIESSDGPSRYGTVDLSRKDWIPITTISIQCFTDSSGALSLVDQESVYGVFKIKEYIFFLFGRKDYDLFRPSETTQFFIFPLSGPKLEVSEKAQKKEIVDYIPYLDDSNMTRLYFDKIWLYQQDYMTGEKRILSGPDIKNDYPYTVYDSHNKAIFKTDYSTKEGSVMRTCVFFYHRKPLPALLSTPIYLQECTLSFSEKDTTSLSSLIAYVYHNPVSNITDIRPVGEITNRRYRKIRQFLSQKADSFLQLDKEKSELARIIPIYD